MVETELKKATVNGQDINFAYDANGIRINYSLPEQYQIDTLFFDYEIAE